MKSPANRPCLFTFAAEPVAGQGSAIGGFKGVAYSGGLVPNYGGCDIAIDLATLTAPETVTVLYAHDDLDIQQIIGTAKVFKSANDIRLEGRFTEATEAGRTAAKLLAEGVLNQFSVGINARWQPKDNTQDTAINGQSLRIGFALEDARLLEISFVPAGADPNTSAERFAARFSASPKEPSIMSDQKDLSRIAELEAAVATLTQERDDAKAALLASQLAARNATRLAALKPIFGESAEAQLAVFSALDDDAFTKAVTGMAALKAPTTLNPALTRPHSGSTAAQAGTAGASLLAAVEKFNPRKAA